MAEKWKPVKYKGRDTSYEVSDQGRVRHKITQRIKTTTINHTNNGREIVSLKIGRYHWTVQVATLVARAFLGRCPKGKCVEHWDQNKLNNVATNLVYLTRKENMRRHFAINGAKRVREKNRFYSQETHDLIKRLVGDGHSRSKVARSLGITISAVSRIAAGKVKAKETGVTLVHDPSRLEETKLPRKFSDETIAEVMALRGQLSPSVVGRMHGMNRRYVHDLWSGKGRGKSAA
jgi:hypothetical protein